MRRWLRWNRRPSSISGSRWVFLLPWSRSCPSRRTALMTAKRTPIAQADYRISVVMPVFSETDTARLIVAWLREHLAERLHEIIIVISPRSTKESYAVCEEMTRLDDRVGLYTQRVN